MAILDNLGPIVTAVGGLGTAAFGLVDASKVIYGGVNNIGFGGIREWVSKVVPNNADNGLALTDVIATLRGNWFSGTDLASQKAIAKSLVKLNFNSKSAERMAEAAGVNRTMLTQIAEAIETGTTLTAAQSDVYARFDAILTAQLDATYRRADQKYVNATRAWAMVASVLLAIAGACALKEQWPANADLGQAILIGLLATPLAPIAKDLSSALATAVNTLQLVKR
jgi:hypothetical protein